MRKIYFFVISLLLLARYSAQAQPNDNCSGAIPIACGGTASGTTASATIDGPATTCTGSTSIAPDVWYTVVGTGTGITASLCGSAYDTKIDIYTGSCGAFTSVGCNDDFCGLQSQVSWASALGTTYYIRVHGFGGATGAYTLNVTCAAPITNDDCTGAINIACGQTINATTAGANPDAVPTCVTSLNTAPGVWYTFVGDGQNTTLSLCGSSYDTKIGVFTGSCGSLTCLTGNDDYCGLQSQVSFLTTNGTTYYVLVTGFNTASGAFTLARTCLPAIPNDVCAGAININCGQTISGTTVGATPDAVPTCVTTLNTAPGLWYSFVGTGTDNTLSLCGSAYDTKIGVFTGTCGALVCVTGNDDFCGLQSQVTVPNTISGTTYYVLVTGFSSASGAFTLSRTCAPPANDVCANAVTINCGQTITGTTVLCTPDAVASCGTTLNTAPGIWYKFVGDGSPVTMSLCGSSYDTKIGIFSGTCGTLTCVTGNDDFCGLQSQATFNTNAGFTYYVLVTGFSSASGNFTLTRTCAPACSGVPSPGAIAPVTSTVCVGSPVTLTVSGYSSNTGLTFQWKQAPAAVGPYTTIAGATSNVYSFSAPAATTYYTCTVTCTNGNGNGTTAPVVVNVSNIVFSSAVATPSTVCSPGSVTITSTVTGGLNLGNYTYTLTGPGTIGPAVPSGPNNSSVSFSVTNIPAGNQVYTLTATDPVPCSKNTTINVTVNLTPVVTLAPLNPTICNGAIQPITGTVSTGTGTVVYSPVTELYTDAAATIAYTGTALATGTTIYAKPTVTRTYTATVTSAQNCVSTTTTTITVNQLPAITVQPTPATQTICPGFNVTYTVTATGTGLTYQWRQNGVNLTNGLQANLSVISGATTNSLTINALGVANTGNYDVVVSGTCPPSVTSNAVVLNVATAPTITTQPANATICAINAINNTTAVFSVAATGVPPPTIYQWQVSSNAGVTWTNLANSATGASPFYNNVFTSALTVANAPVSLNGNRYRVIVTNSCGQSVTSNGSATLTVNAIPVVTTVALSNRICISDTLINLVGSPVGGVWSGIGVYGNTFIPMRTAIGTYTLTYTYTGANTCTAVSVITAKVEDCPERIRQFDNKGVLLYPNPNDGHFSIRINTTLFNYLGMRVYTMSGSLVNVQSWTNLQYGRIIPVDLSKLPGGVYQVKLFYDDGAQTDEKTYNVVIAH